MKLNRLGVVDTPPAHGNFGIKDARLLVLGHPERSLIPHRMKAARLEDGRMPRVGSLMVDEKGTKLIQDWIKQLPKEK